MKNLTAMMNLMQSIQTETEMAYRGAELETDTP